MSVSEATTEELGGASSSPRVETAALQRQGAPAARYNAGVAPLFLLPASDGVAKGDKYWKFSMTRSRPKWVETGICDSTALPSDAVLLPELIAALAADHDAVLGAKALGGSSLTKIATKFKPLSTLTGPVLFIGKLHAVRASAGAGEVTPASANAGWLADAGIVSLFYVPCSPASKYLLLVGCTKSSRAVALTNLATLLGVWQSRNRDKGAAITTLRAAGLSISFEWFDQTFVRCVGPGGHCEVIRGVNLAVARLKAAVAGALVDSPDADSSGLPPAAGNADTGDSADAEDAGTELSADEGGSEDESANLLARRVPPPAKRLRGLPPEEAVAQNLWEVALRVPPYAYSALHDVSFVPATAAAASSTASSTARPAAASSAGEGSGDPDEAVRAQ
jgi:hypothetical protein